jgi:hypothetical protein
MHRRNVRDCVETAATLAPAGASRDFSGHMQIFAPKSPDLSGAGSIQGEKAIGHP